MQLNDDDRRFLLKRAKLVRTWPFVGAILLTILIGLGIWLFLTRPLLVNPLNVMTRLENNSIPESTVTLMAGMLPIVVSMCLLLAVMIVLFVFAALSNEKKYLKIIQQNSHDRGIAQQDASSDEGKGPRLII